MRINIETSKKKKSSSNKTNNTKTTTVKKSMEFSKRLLIYDYFIALVLLCVLFLCLCINGIYTIVTTNNLVQMGMDISAATISSPFDLNIIGTVLGIWTGQLAISSGAYYLMSKSDHKIQLPIRLINDLPKDIKNNVDMTTIITSVLSSTDN